MVSIAFRSPDGKLYRAAGIGLLDLYRLHCYGYTFSGVDDSGYSANTAAAAAILRRALDSPDILPNGFDFVLNALERTLANDGR